MKVAELKRLLEVMPDDAPVQYIFDGCALKDVEHVWLANNGSVMVCDAGEPVYSDESAPQGFVSTDDSEYYQTPHLPREER